MFNKKRKMIVVALSCGLLIAMNTNGQRNADSLKAKGDTTHKPFAAPVIKPYKDLITADMKTQKGFLTVHQKDDKYYFEVPNNILGRDILIVSRVSKASAEMRNGFNGYAGDQIGETVFRFEMGPS